ncbi:PAAR domain-containing protein [Sodalis sp. dw_96]|uniref:PAAR domain-containing protein n=1 Tax=Sodalis sp. dw_96 TaxID=2719794 RepID=UPI001BD26F9D|nr:PAAR domain-containing protein [Sodalis sp. dw_96]
MARALVCLGDKTSFGEVVSATATGYEGDKPIAQSGDKATCSKCNGDYPIIASAVGWGETQPYAATGDRVACDCSDHYVFGSASQYTITGAGSAQSGTQ